jgi:S-formylglutathione hydrolase FrmB
MIAERNVASVVETYRPGHGGGDSAASGRGGKHGYYSAEAKAERAETRALIRAARYLMAELD